MTATADTWTNPSAMRRSLDPLGIFKSPLDEGKVHIGYEGLVVKLLKGPDAEDIDVIGTLAAAAHAGAFGDVVDLIREGRLLEVKALDIASVGLEQVLEGESVVFLIYGCSRGFTHELVRTRKGAWFVQQTMRHTDMGRRPNVRMPLTIAADDERRAAWLKSINAAIDAYARLVGDDTPYEDARTVLPIATETWIIAGMPLRTWLETYAYRACYMFYPEMRWVFRRMREELARVAPRIAERARVSCEVRGVCTYRGAEDTEPCPIYPGAREWRSPEYDDRMLRLKALADGR